MSYSLDSSRLGIVTVFGAALICGVCGCSDDPPNSPEQPSGRLTLTWSAVGAGNPDSLQVVLTPGPIRQTFLFSTGTGEIGALSPGTYSGDFRALDSEGRTTHQKLVDGIVIQHGTSTPVDLELQTTIPSAPTSVSASINDPDEITVMWTPEDGLATGFKVLRKREDENTYSQRAIVTTGSTYVDGGTTAAYRYSYKIRAYSDGGESLDSAVATGFRMGLRLESVSLYQHYTAIHHLDKAGFKFRAWAYGYEQDVKVCIVYAVYDLGDGYRVTPGTFCLHYGGSGCPEGRCYAAAGMALINPGPNVVSWDFTTTPFVISASDWASGWRDDSPPQYINMRIYRNSPVCDLSEPWHAETGYYRIHWVESVQGGSSGAALRKLSESEALALEQELRSDNLFSDDDWMVPIVGELFDGVR